MKKINAEFIEKLVNEGLFEFCVVSQISSDNTLEKENIEDRLDIIKSMKLAVNDSLIKGKGKYLDLLSDCEEILLKELKDLSKKKLKNLVISK